MKKILIISSTVTYPTSSGGHERVYHIANELGKRKDLDVRVYAPYVRRGNRTGSNKIVKREYFTEYMHHTPVLQTMDFVLSKITYPRWIYGLCARWLAKKEFFKELTERSSHVLFSRPDLVDMIDGTNLPISYLSHNVEREMVKNLGYSRGSNLRETAMKKKELKLCSRSMNVFVCSEYDKQSYISSGVSSKKISILPNGKTKPKRSIKELELPMIYENEARTKIVFVGSSHGPNQEGLERIYNLAKDKPKLVFFILGSVCKGKVDKENVIHLGFVSEREKSMYLYYADRAINPIWSGGGSSLKVVDYMIHGLPIISSDFGMRGFELYNNYVSISKEGGLLNLNNVDVSSLRNTSEKLSQKFIRGSLVELLFIG